MDYGFRSWDLCCLELTEGLLGAMRGVELGLRAYLRSLKIRFKLAVIEVFLILRLLAGKEHLAA